MDKRHKQLAREAINLTKKSKYYQTLTQRQFRAPRGYKSFIDICVDLSMHLLYLKEQWAIRGKQEKDTAFISMSLSSLLAYQDPLFPVFAITPELCEAFLQTDLPAHVCHVNKMFRQALLLIPTGVLYSPDNLPVEWLLVTHWLKGECLPEINKEDLDYDVQVENGAFTVNKISWVSLLGSQVYGGIFYSSTFELQEDLDKPITGELDLKTGDKEDINAEQAFLRQVDKLLLQTMLYMQTVPEGVNTKVPANTHKGTGFNKPKGASLLEPIWVGRDYKINKINQEGTGTHASPRMHWRRGHWKRVAIGAGRTERKWTWVQPTLVNAE